MNKHRIFGFVSMGAALLMVISLFLPCVSVYSINMSLWKMEDPSRVLIIILAVFVIALYLINKKTEMSYITAGFVTFHAISLVISAEGLENFSIGFYLLILSSLTIGVMTFLYDEKQSKGVINLSFNKQPYTRPMYQQPVYQQQVPQQPVYQQPIQQQPQINPQPVQQQPTVVGYDPNTGAPIYSNQNNN